MLLGVGVAIAVLYADMPRKSDRSSRDYCSGSQMCLSAVPSDALMVSCFSNASDACKGVMSSSGFLSDFAGRLEDGSLSSMKKCSMAVSVHYAGRLYPLFIIDIDRISEETLSVFKALADHHGMSFMKVGTYAAVSKSETIVRSAARHHEKKVSVADAPGFRDALSSVSWKDMMLVSNLHVQRLMSSVFSGYPVRQSAFLERICDWMAFEVGDSRGNLLAWNGRMIYDGDPDEFMSVLEGCGPSVSEVARVLPSYTFSAVSLPMRNLEKYMASYQNFIDSRQGLPNFKSKQQTLGKTVGIMPEDFFKSLQVKEIASASFVVAGRLERVNLIHAGTRDPSLIFKGNEITSLKGYTPSVHSWAYSSYVSSVFGRFFSLPDESCFTYIDGWIITGSRAAVDEYVSHGALDYTLDEYQADAGAGGLLTGRPSLMSGYISLTENSDVLGAYMKQDVKNLVAKMTEESDYVPAVIFLSEDKEGISSRIEIKSLTLKKTKAPSHERDTVVVVPAGPFKVKNSATGKTNTFYQNSQNAICLRDETGKDLWGVPLGKKICGTAHNVDYYANGKLQIIFGAGSNVYIIDRLGRYVNGFPLELGKEISLGPDIYDFTGARRYNIMILHKDNTIQMYNLKGKKPEAWKGITSAETIKSLPERLTVGGKDYWVVRTSLQTQIFPFYGGDPLVRFEGDSMIRPDSEIKPVDASSVQVVSYDGKSRTVKLK